MLENVEVYRHLKELTAEVESTRIATVVELREFWTSTFREDNNDFKDRLKASELLGKSLGTFIEKRQQSGRVVVEVVYSDD